MRRIEVGSRVTPLRRGRRVRARVTAVGVRSVSAVDDDGNSLRFCMWTGGGPGAGMLFRELVEWNRDVVEVSDG